MTLNINQFALTSVQGQLDLETQGTVISCQVDAGQGTALVAGQPVKLATTGGGLPKVIGLAANTDQSFGFVVRNLKDQSFPAKANLEVALFGSVMWMTAGGAITRGASVEVVQSTPGQVITTGGTNPVIGFALDKAVNSGDLIRVFIQAPFSAVNAALNGGVKTVNVTATISQINAGKVLINGATGQAITVLNYIARVAGNFATGTGVYIDSTNGTPVVVSTILEAALTTGAVNLPSSANNTLGAGFGVPLGVGDGLQVANDGTAQTGGTSIDFTITYLQQ